MESSDLNKIVKHNQTFTPLRRAIVYSQFLTTRKMGGIFMDIFKIKRYSN